MGAFFASIKKDLYISWRSQWDVLLVLTFFLATGALFPLSMGGNLNILANVAGSITMTLAMLAALLSMDRLFLFDYEDGSLDMLSRAPFSLLMVVLAKALSHWLTTLLPLLLFTPLLAIIMGVKPRDVWLIPLFLALATPGLSLLGTFGAALTLGSHRVALLMIFLILPLFIPFLIFTSLGIHLGQKGEDIGICILFLVSLNLLALASLPWATAYALKDAVKS